MSEQQAAILKPETIVEEFKKNGVTHVVTIPDSETNYLYELMQKQPWLDVIPTSREGETFSVSFGLFVGGKVPVCLIQNTGMLESGDSMRLCARCQLPAGLYRRLPGLDTPGQDHGFRGALYRAIFDRVWHQLLFG